MDSPLVFIAASLATYYLAYCVSTQAIEGPFAVFLWLRNRLNGDTWVGRGIRCIVCVSFYTAALWAIVLVLLGHVAPWDGPLVWLGLAGSSVVIDKYWRR